MLEVGIGAISARGMAAEKTIDVAKGGESGGPH